MATTDTDTAVEGDAGGDAPGLICRKCGLAQPDGPACRRCGLARDRMASFAGTPLPSAPPAVEAAWAAVRADWSSPARHQALVAAALAADALPALARLYREEATAGPDATRADAGRRAAEVGRMAVAALAAEARPRPEVAAPGYKGLKTVVVLVVVVALVGAILAVLRPPPRQPDRLRGGPSAAPAGARGGAPPDLARAPDASPN